MPSSWTKEIKAVWAKEFRCELRSRSASITTLFLSAVTVFTLAFGFFGRQMSSDAAAGMLWASLLFAGVGTLSRVFIAEEEQGTGDLLRLWARPEAVFWGKAGFAFVQMLITSAVVTIVFFVLAGIEVKYLTLLVLSLVGGSAALAALMTLVSGLISQGNNRNSLAGVVALPLMIPLIALGVSSARASVDGLAIKSGWAGCSGLWLYTVAVLAMAPHQFCAIWKEQ